MVLSSLDRLRERVNQASAELTSLRKERERLLAEVGLMQEDSRRARRILREHQELLEERRKLKQKLERLHDKLDKLRI